MVISRALQFECLRLELSTWNEPNFWEGAGTLLFWPMASLHLMIRWTQENMSLLLLLELYLRNLINSEKQQIYQTFVFISIKKGIEVFSQHKTWKYNLFLCFQDQDLSLPLPFIVLDGSGSTDDLNITQYFWKQLEGSHVIHC